VTLYEECLEDLGENTISVREDFQKYIESLVETFPFDSWGRIDWSKVVEKASLNNTKDILRILNEKNIGECKILIIWDETTLPVVETSLNSALNVLDDVLAVSFDTWLFDVNKLFIIEFHHEGEALIGFATRTENYSEVL